MMAGDKKSAIVQRSALLAGLVSVAAAVDRRNIIPILANVALRFSVGTLELVGTNLDMEVARSIPVEGVADQWQTTVSAHLLRELVSKLPEGSEVRLTGEPGLLHIQCGRGKYKLHALPIDDFPIMPGPGERTDAGEPADFVMPGTVLSAMISATKFAVSSEETRYYLNGIAAQMTEDGRLFMVATDGHRLAVAERAAPDGSEALPDIIIPRAMLPLIETLCADAGDGAVAITSSGSKIRLCHGTVVVTGKLIDGTFPDWRRVLDVRNQNQMIFNPSAMTAAVERVRVLSTDKTRAVAIELSGDAVTLSVTSAENGTAQEEFAANYTGDALRIGVNARYFGEVLARLAGDRAEMLFGGARDPILLRVSADADDRFVIMPMNV